MCLLVVLSRCEGAAPLVVGANRDERLDRPALPFTVLESSGPRILGGRDLLAGGTWLAVNGHGVVAGLTNSPLPGGRDPSKRSRGELPLALARHTSAEAAVEDAAARFRPAEFNPAWLLVGDRSSLFLLSMHGDRPSVRSLSPGVYVLENAAPGVSSPKVDHVVSLLGDVSGYHRLGGSPVAGGTEGVARPAGAGPFAGTGDLGQSPPELLARLKGVLGDHSLPPELAPEVAPFLQRGPRQAMARPVPTWAACVHAPDFGTRSSLVVDVPAEPQAPARLLAADGPPCTAPFHDVTALWEVAGDH